MSPEESFVDPLYIRLARAIDGGDVAAINTAVSEGASVNARGKDGYALLYRAIAHGSVTGFDALLANGADVLAESRDAVSSDDVRQRRSILLALIEARDQGFLGSLLRRGFSPNFVLNKKSNESLLFWATYAYSKPTIKSLLDAGATIDHQDFMGYTAMGAAMLGTDYETAWFLLQQGADPTVGLDQGSDVVTLVKTEGMRGVLPGCDKDFENIVTELVKRGLITREEIAEADKRKDSAADTGPPGVTIIEHDPGSEAGQMILRLDAAEAEANQRDQR